MQGGRPGGAVLEALASCQNLCAIQHFQRLRRIPDPGFPRSGISLTPKPAYTPLPLRDVLLCLVWRSDGGDGHGRPARRVQGR